MNSDPPASKKRSKMVIAAVVSLALLLLLLGVAAWHIEDWSRDLSTNHARTAENGKDASLRPLRLPLPPRKTAELVERAAKHLGWVEGQRVENEEGSEIVWKWVRITKLMRFRDDVTVRITPRILADGGAGSLLHVESQSRIGRGDLGQNPRNIRELLAEIERRKLKPDQKDAN